MRILVTGAAGFIGQNLIQHLEKDHTVEGFEYTPNVYPDASRYDWVIHLGAISSTTETNVDKILTQNYEYSMRLLQMCEQMGTNFQYASSASVYGNTEKFKEEDSVSPQSPYAWSKYLIDKFLIDNGIDQFNGLVQSYRYFNVYFSLFVYQNSKLWFFQFILILHKYLKEGTFKLCYLGELLRFTIFLL